MEQEEEKRGNRKVKTGVVVSNKMNKTVVVRVNRAFRHPRYSKVVHRSKKFYAHDEDASTLNVGDKVTIMETRPLSKLKRWRVVRETAKV